LRIACLHTAQSNVGVFDAAASDLGIPTDALLHAVRPDLLASAEAANGLTPAIERDTRHVLSDLAEHADTVLLTCSTLGPCADMLSGHPKARIRRVDRALAEQAVQGGGHVVALCAVETTMRPTATLFAEAAVRCAATVETRLVQGAWARFKAGDQPGYLRAVADAADAAYADGASVVALAQASMAGAASLATNGRPLSSPIAGLCAIVGMHRAHP
jgi:hypothetical protein